MTMPQQAAPSRLHPLVLRKLRTWGLLAAATVTVSCGTDDADDDGGAEVCDVTACLQAPAPVCEGSSLVRFGVTGECDETAACIFSRTAETCEQGCVDAGCVGDPCEGVVCDVTPEPFCDGSVYVTSSDPGRCEEGQCLWDQTRQDCAADNEVCTADGCVPADTDACAGLVCNEPPPSSCDVEGLLVAAEAEGTCVEGGCVYDTTTSACPAGEVCFGGECTPPNPCDGVICDVPPATTCVGNVVVSYAGEGRCQGGDCIYPEQRQDCTLAGQTCVDGACAAGTDPCDGITCDTPPAWFCEDAVAVQYGDTGTCTRGTCTWSETRIDCDEVGLPCINGECADLCFGVVCTEPAVATCRENVAVTRALPGVCVNGFCSYEEVLTDCDATGRVCINGECISF